MKWLILNILLVISITCHGNYYSTHSNYYSKYNSIPTEQTYRGIGYTTNYGNSFGQTTVNYQQTYNCVYKPIYNTTNTTENNSGQSNGYRPGGSPRKVSGVGGWITWLTWGMYNGVPSSASNEDMYAYYDYVNNGGTDSYDTWYENTYNSGIGGPPSPPDPFADPIGELPIGLTLIMVFTYIYYKYKLVLNKKQ